MSETSKTESAWEERRSIEGERDRVGDHRSPYERDRARVVHSAAFRRLQSKTQVFGVGESDYYRTRLTHSLEVAQIGVGILGSLRSRYGARYAELPTRDLIETICFSHDIGHPPFGHGGEVALNYVMSGKGGFEGNAQTLRILSRLGKITKSDGLNLTRRSLLGVIKYPSTYSQTVKYSVYPEEVRDERERTDHLVERLHSPRLIKKSVWKPPKCIYDEEKDVIDWILKVFDKNDREVFIQTESREDKHRRSVYMSLDTTILELADDIAYSVHDLEDAIALQQVHREDWEEFIEDHGEDYFDVEPGYRSSDLSDDLFSGEHWRRKRATGTLVNHFIVNSQIIEREKFQHRILDLKVQLPAGDAEFLNKLSKFTTTRVIKQPEVQRLEFKGQKILVDLFKAFYTDPKRLLSKSTQEWMRLAVERGELEERVICDYLAGMTDTYAEECYLTLFHPTAGSIFKAV